MIRSIAHSRTWFPVVLAMAAVSNLACIAETEDSTQEDVAEAENPIDAFIPNSGIIARADANGVIGVNGAGNLIRKYWANSQWNTQVIPTWGGRVVAGSLIQGEGTGSNGNVYCINEHDQLCTIWNNAGVITYALLPTYAVQGSLVMSNGNGVFGVGSGGQLVRTYYSNGWQGQGIATWGGKPVPGALIAGEWSGANANVYGVNENRQMFTTWVNAGVITYALIPGATGLALAPPALANGNGVFAITQTGGLMRAYYSGGWQVQNIPTWGGKLVAHSLIAGENIGANANVYGVNEAGQMFTTWNPGTITYALIPGTQNISPTSLVLSNGNGVFGVTTSGGLMRAYYSNGWHVQNIPTWGGKLIASSLIAGEGTGANANVYGVNEAGQMFTTWVNNNQITFALIP